LLESNDEGPVQTTFNDLGADGRLQALRTDSGPSRTDSLFDGRGFLRQSMLTVAGSSDTIRVTPAYTSQGVLMARTEERQWTGASMGADGEDQASISTSNETTQVFYFAGRPVAQLTSGSDVLYLTTDHLGTIVLATDAPGSVVWAGGVEPFGVPWTAGPDNPDVELSSAQALPIASKSALSRLSSERVFLRYPGQWTSDAFRVTNTQQDTYYNVHRWYQPATGRYSQADPIGLRGGPNLYQYALGRPTVLADRLGLRVQVCCRPTQIIESRRHCFIRLQDDQTGDLRTRGLEIEDSFMNRARAVMPSGTIGRVPDDRNADNPEYEKDDDCGAWVKDDCGMVDACALRTTSLYPRESYYYATGPNSNSFASYVATQCNLAIPESANGWDSPGWWTREEWSHHKPGEAPPPAFPPR
jgi:RHS repeat-associated protein